jgi:hypothetical protein
MPISLTIAALWLLVFVTLLAVVWSRPMPVATEPPDDAVAIGDGYMRVWATPRRVHVRFRNTGVTVLFDRRASKEFGEWLASLE